ncbi:zinc-binding dehydrogenase [Sphingomonas sp. Tas61C01]|uniref:zinc-binding dehydrogenase n=1 Tax=Sphingomonas sp. Tas61C01 TaxID=3458297 RepID=UPI00403E9EBC
MADGFTGLQLRSCVTGGGELQLTLAQVDTPPPGPGEVVVRIEAAPINPSDLGLLTGPADLSTLVGGDDAGLPTATATIPEKRMPGMKARLDQAMPVGNEGAGTVVAAGDGAEHLLGKTVALIAGAMYAEYRTVRAADAFVLPDDATPAEGASVFVNPLTALGMIETMRLEGHSALIHTAAASNLGQMLNRICIADNIPLVNIVRNDAQAALLRDAGAVHVCDSSTPDFAETLTDAVVTTGATIAFDAIGGGDLVNRILTAIEAAANRKAGGYSRYGSSVHKQAYIYGSLDVRPTTIDRNFGLAWGIGGWLLTPFLARVGPARTAELRARVNAELKTTFASHYTRVISLREALDPAVIAAYARRATGEKFLIDPSR